MINIVIKNQIPWNFLRIRATLFSCCFIDVLFHQCAWPKRYHLRTCNVSKSKRPIAAVRWGQGAEERAQQEVTRLAGISFCTSACVSAWTANEQVKITSRVGDSIWAVQSESGQRQAWLQRSLQDYSGSAAAAAAASHTHTQVRLQAQNYWFGSVQPQGSLRVICEEMHNSGSIRWCVSKQRRLVSQLAAGLAPLIGNWQ